MSKDKVSGYGELLGEVLVVAGAAAWMFVSEIAQWGFAVGVVLLAIGRLGQTPFYQKYSERDPKELTLKRLYHQRVFGIVALILSATFMFLPTGFYYGLYLGRTSWLVPFVLFTVIEIYTVFRISAVEKG